MKLMLEIYFFGMAVVCGGLMAFERWRIPAEEWLHWRKQRPHPSSYSDRREYLDKRANWLINKPRKEDTCHWK